MVDAIKDALIEEASRNKIEVEIKKEEVEMKNRKSKGRKVWKKQRPRKECDLFAYLILNLQIRTLMCKSIFR
jgi:hypothetical protein